MSDVGAGLLPEEREELARFDIASYPEFREYIVEAMGTETRYQTIDVRAAVERIPDRDLMAMAILLGDDITGLSIGTQRIGTTRDTPTGEGGERITGSEADDRRDRVGAILYMYMPEDRRATYPEPDNYEAGVNEWWLVEQLGSSYETLTRTLGSDRALEIVDATVRSVVGDWVNLPTEAPEPTKIVDRPAQEYLDKPLNRVLSTARIAGDAIREFMGREGALREVQERIQTVTSAAQRGARARPYNLDGVADYVLESVVGAEDQTAAEAAALSTSAYEAVPEQGMGFGDLVGRTAQELFSHRPKPQRFQVGDWLPSSQWAMWSDIQAATGWQYNYETGRYIDPEGNQYTASQAMSTLLTESFVDPSAGGLLAVQHRNTALNMDIGAPGPQVIPGQEGMTVTQPSGTVTDPETGREYRLGTAAADAFLARNPELNPNVASGSSAAEFMPDFDQEGNALPAGQTPELPDQQPLDDTPSPGDALPEPTNALPGSRAAVRESGRILRQIGETGVDTPAEMEEMIRRRQAHIELQHHVLESMTPREISRMGATMSRSEIIRAQGMLVDMGFLNASTVAWGTWDQQTVIGYDQMTLGMRTSGMTMGEYYANERSARLADLSAANFRWREQRAEEARNRGQLNIDITLTPKLTLEYALEEVSRELFGQRRGVLTDEQIDSISNRVRDEERSRQMALMQNDIKAWNEANSPDGKDNAVFVLDYLKNNKLPWQQGDGRTMQFGLDIEDFGRIAEALGYEPDNLSPDNEWNVMYEYVSTLMNAGAGGEGSQQMDVRSILAQIAGHSSGQRDFDTEYDLDAWIAQGNIEIMQQVRQATDEDINARHLQGSYNLSVADSMTAADRDAMLIQMAKEANPDAYGSQRLFENANAWREALMSPGVATRVGGSV